MIALISHEDVIHWEQPHTLTQARLHSATHGSDCGCFSASVRVNLCRPPTVAAKHTHTFPDDDQLAPECL